jgi:hypothetical protein
MCEGEPQDQRVLDDYYSGPDFLAVVQCDLAPTPLRAVSISSTDDIQEN